MIKNYVVQYSSDKTTYLSQAIQDNSTRLLLTSLSPYTIYYIKVQAVNLAGAGPFSEPMTNRTFEDGKLLGRDVSIWVLGCLCHLSTDSFNFT